MKDCCLDETSSSSGSGSGSGGGSSRSETPGHIGRVGIGSGRQIGDGVGSGSGSGRQECRKKMIIYAPWQKNDGRVERINF